MTHSDEPGAIARDRRRPSIVSLSKFMPYSTVPHAGGQYVYLHDRALMEFADVAHLVPDNPENRHALTQDTGAPGRTLRGVGPAGDGSFRLLSDLESAWSRSAIAWPYRRLFQTARGPWESLSAADVIEFHWSEMIALAPLVRERVPGTPLVGVAHDVITQRWRRATITASDPLRRAAYRMAAARSLAGEARSFAAVDALIVFSEKDADLAVSLSPKANVQVVHPGLGPTSPVERRPDPEEPVVLFTGALDRVDNWKSISWFIERIWPSIVTENPAARLVIAGAKPPASLQDLVSRTRRAELTGFVPSLEPYYAQASVFVAPLLSGAGVKFKTVDAMLRGVPVVATPVGAEGIGDQSLFAAITDEPAEFARAVTAELRSPDVERTRRAVAWSDEVYGSARFASRIREVYGALGRGA